MLKSECLRITHPNISNEWDYEKNKELTPDLVSKGQQKKVYWLCEKGHSYIARIDHRCSMNSGCPYCANKKPIKGENDLKTLFPEYETEWDYINNDKFPDEYLPYSNKSVYWMCPICNVNYKRKINERTINGLGCPICIKESHTSKQEQTLLFYLSKVTETENRAKINGKEIDIYLPIFNVGIEYNGEYYHKDKKERDKKKIAALEEEGVSIISLSCGRERKVLNNEIVLKANEFSNPTDHEFEWGIKELFGLLNISSPTINLQKDAVDIYCLYIKTIKQNSIAYVYPEVAKEWDYTLNKGLKPEAFPYGSHKKVWWKCPICNYSYDMDISHRTIGKNGCPYCAGKRIMIGYNDLATTHSNLVKEWDYEYNSKMPTEYTKGSDHKAGWICGKCGHRWVATISSRTQGIGCPVCTGRVVIEGHNDFATLYPECSKLWNYSKNEDRRPEQYRPHSNQSFWWLCDKCGHEWKTSISSIVRGSRCPECAKKDRPISRNETYLNKKGSLLQQFPDLIREWDYIKNTNIDPNLITPGSHKTAWWKCLECGNEWESAIYTRTKGHGCRKCANKKANK